LGFFLQTLNNSYHNMRKAKNCTSRCHNMQSKTHKMPHHSSQSSM
jgi:hypothetical protein